MSIENEKMTDNRSFNVGDSVLYHRDFPFIQAYVIEIKDNGFGLWIRFAKKINGLVVDKFVSCYDVSKNCEVSE